MDVVATLDANCGRDALRPWLDDLARYPQWLTIVTAAAPTAPDGDRPAWIVDLRGRIGPLARSKRLRMVRTVNDAGRIVFERRQADGRNHSPWVLTADLADLPDATAGTRLTMRLHYGGGLWGPVLERMLGSEIEHGKGRLVALATAG